MAWLFNPDAEPEPETGATVADVGKAAASAGVGMLRQPFSAAQVATADYMPNASLITRGISKLFSTGQDYIDESITPGGKRARDAQFIPEDGAASVTEAPISSFFMKGAGVAPQVAAMYLFPASALGMASAGGTMQIGQMVDNVVAATNKMTDQELAAESPVFNHYLEQGMAPEEARKRLIAAQVDGKDLLAAGLIGAAGMGAAARVLKQGALAGNGLAARTSVGALDAGAGLGAAAGQLDVAQQHADIAKGKSEDGEVDWHKTLAAGLNGFLEGGVLGAVGGAAHKPKTEPKPKQAAATQTDASGVDPSVAAALKAETAAATAPLSGAVDTSKPNLDVAKVLDEALPGTKGGVPDEKVGASAPPKGASSGTATPPPGSVSTGDTSYVKGAKGEAAKRGRKPKVAVVEPTGADPAQAAALDAATPGTGPLTEPTNEPLQPAPEPLKPDPPVTPEVKVPEPPTPLTAPVEPVPDAPAAAIPVRPVEPAPMEQQPSGPPKAIAAVAQPAEISAPPAAAPDPAPPPRVRMAAPPPLEAGSKRETTNVVARVEPTALEKQQNAEREAAAQEFEANVNRGDKGRVRTVDEVYDVKSRNAALREAAAAVKAAAEAGTQVHKLYTELMQAAALVPKGGMTPAKKALIERVNKVERKLREAKDAGEIQPPALNKGGRKPTSETATNVARRTTRKTEQALPQDRSAKEKRADAKKESELRRSLEAMRKRGGVTKKVIEATERRWLLAAKKIRELTPKEELRLLELEQGIDAQTEVTGRDIQAKGGAGLEFIHDRADEAASAGKETGADALEAYDAGENAKAIPIAEIGEAVSHPDDVGKDTDTKEHDYGEVELTPAQKLRNALIKGEVMAKSGERLVEDDVAPVYGAAAKPVTVVAKPTGRVKIEGIRSGIGEKGKIALGVLPRKAAVTPEVKEAPKPIPKGATQAVGEGSIRHSTTDVATPYHARTSPDAPPKRFKKEAEARAYLDAAPKAEAPKIAEAPKVEPPKPAEKPAPKLPPPPGAGPMGKVAEEGAPKKVVTEKAKKAVAVKKPKAGTMAETKAKVDDVRDAADQVSADLAAREASKKEVRDRTVAALDDMNAAIANIKTAFALPKVDAAKAAGERVAVKEDAVRDYKTGEAVEIDAYHGTTAAFTEFDNGKKGSNYVSDLGAHWFTASPKAGESYAIRMEQTQFDRDAGKPAVLKGTPTLHSVKVNLKNPLVVDMQGAHYDPTLWHMQIVAAKKGGHDGVIMKNAVDGGGVKTTVYAVLDGKQVKIKESRRVTPEVKSKRVPNGREYKTGEHPEVTVVAHSAGTADSIRREINETIAHDIQGDIFTAGADAVVSPANSVGHMNGGIDLRYLNHFGKQLETRVREKIVAEYGGELPIGEAFVIRTRPEGVAMKANEPEWLIVTPTMTQPGAGRASPDVVHKAMLAALRAGREAGVEHMAIPSMGTGVGKLDAGLAAKAMQRALNDFEEEIHATQKSKFDPASVRARAEAMRKEFEAEAGERMQPIYHGTRDTTTERTINTQDIKLRRSDLHGGEAHYGWYSPEQALDWAREKFGDRASIFTSFIPQEAMQRLSKTKDVVVRPMHWQKDGSPDPAYPHEVVLSPKALDEIYHNERLLSKHEGAATMTDQERLALIQEALGPDAKVALNARENSFERRKGLIRLMADADRTAVLHEIFHAIERGLKPHEMALVQNHPMFKEVMGQVKQLYPELSGRGQFMEALAETSARLRNQHLTDGIVWRTIEKIRAKLAAWGRLVTGADISDVRDLLHEVYSGGRKSERVPSMGERLAEVAQSRFIETARTKLADAVDQPGMKAGWDRVSNALQTFGQLGQKAEKLGLGEHGRKVAEDNERMRVYRQKLLEGDPDKGIVGGHEISRDLSALERKHKGPVWNEFASLTNDATIANVHPDVALSDAKNAHISGDKTRDWQSKARHAELARRYNALPDDLKAAWHKTTDLFSRQENDIREQMVGNYVEAILGKADRALSRKIHEGTLTEAEKAPLMVSAGMKALLEAPELRSVKGAYFPLMRRGEYVVHGEYKIAPPGVTQAFSIPTTKGKKKAFAVTSGVNGDTATFTTDASVKGAQAALRRTVGEWTGKQDIKHASTTSYVSDANGKRDPNGSHITFEVGFHTKHVEFHDSLKDAEAARAARMAEGVDMKAVDRKREGLWSNGDLMSARLQTVLKSMEQRKEWGQKSQSERDAIKGALMEASLRSASQNRVAKRSMERKGIAGASEDLARNALDYSGSNASFLAGQKYRPQIETSMRAMGKAIDDDGYSKHTLERRQLHNSMQQRLNQNADPDGAQGPMDGAINRALQLSFLDKLASPAFHAVNSLQPGMVTLPMLTARHGFKAIGALTRAYKEIGGLRTLGEGVKETRKALSGYEPAHDYLKSFKERVKDDGAKRMLQELHDVGLLDRHAGMEMNQIVSPDKNIAFRGLDRADHIARQMGQAVESMNRAVAALSAYRLEMEAHGNHDRAVKYAKDMVADTQGNYSRSNAPAAFNTRLGRATLQFKKFSQMMYSLLGKQIGAALKGDREAMKALVGIGVTHAAMAGALGLPTEPIKLMLLSANALGVTNTSWGDVEEQARAFAAEYLGKTGGEALMKGLPRLLGIDLSTRVGLDSMLTYGEPRKMDAASTKAWMWDTVKGAPMGLAEDFARGAHALTSGDYAKAAELMVPFKTVSDMVKAGKGLAEGKQTARGKELMSPLNPLEAASKAFGITPAREAEANAASSAAYRKTAALRESRREILAAYSEGKKTVADIVKWNNGKPAGEQIKLSSLQRSKKDRAKPQVLGQTVQPWNKRTLEGVGETYNTR